MDARQASGLGEKRSGQVAPSFLPAREEGHFQETFRFRLLKRATPFEPTSSNQKDERVCYTINHELVITPETKKTSLEEVHCSFFFVSEPDAVQR